MSNPLNDVCNGAYFLGSLLFMFCISPFVFPLWIIGKILRFFDPQECEKLDQERASVDT